MNDKAIPDQPPLAWSHSRAKLFDECRRAYYYRYYLAWGGWKRNAPDPSRQAYALKQMSGLPLWTGQVVHTVIEDALAGRCDRTEEAMVAHARRLFAEGVGEAYRRDWQHDPKNCLNLMEIHYGPAPTEDELEEAEDTAADCIRMLWMLPLWRAILSLPASAFLAMEGFATFRVGDGEAIVKPDLAFRVGDTVNIVDWKTGKPRDADRTQLAAYALFASQRWQAPPERIQVTTVYLRTGDVLTRTPDAADLAAAKLEIRNSLERMRAVHPATSAEGFDRTDHRATCRWCPFGELCGRRSPRGAG